MTATKTARDLGIDFATMLNATPAEAQNWRKLEQGDDVPVDDYRALIHQFGDVTAEMERAYRDGFNETFKD